ncbi:MAG: hypothetical protein IPI46_00725 [Bacteroidetes bacterium]|nr:hypothetical protein [Bacteroidota bacterium]
MSIRINYNLLQFLSIVVQLCAYSIVSIAQTLKPSVIASAGGNSLNSGYSLSYTFGETNTATLSNAGYTLTQGFQQTYKMTLNLKAFLQGYYKNGSMMENVLYTEGITASPGAACDTIQIELRENTSPYSVVSASKQIIQTNGSVTFNGIANAGNAYFIVVKHRNSIETWSTYPVLLTENTYYDFTTAATAAYGNNQIEVEPGIFALYSGDINQDQNADLLDAAILETSIANFDFGYFATDINGDGNVDLLDSPMLEVNVNGFIYSVHP